MMMVKYVCVAISSSSASYQAYERLVRIIINNTEFIMFIVSFFVIWILIAAEQPEYNINGIALYGCGCVLISVWLKVNLSLNQSLEITLKFHD